MITMFILAVGGFSYREWFVCTRENASNEPDVTKKSTSPLSLLMLAAALWLLPAASAQVADEDDFESVQAVDENQKPGGETVDVAQVSQSIVDQTNAFRRDQELEPVQTDGALTKTAQNFAEFMAREDQYGHTADGKRPSERAKDHGYDFCIVAENIAYQFNSAGFETKELATKFVTGWKNSPEHRDNMLDADVIETGVAVARSDKTGYYYAVQMFGRPKSAMIEFQIENESEETVDYTIGDRTFTLPPRYTRTHRRCRPLELTFQLPDDKTKTVDPATGDEFTIASGGELTRGSPGR